MGATQSGPSKPRLASDDNVEIIGQAPIRTRVFVPESPIDFSQALLANLEERGQIESDYTRNQYKEIYLEQQVSQLLEKNIEEALNKVDQSLKHVDSNNKDTSTSSSSISSSQVSEKLQHLSKILESRPKIRKTNEQVQKSKDSLVSCLNNHTHQPLRCIEEFDAFKKAVDSLEEKALNV